MTHPRVISLAARKNHDIVETREKAFASIHKINECRTTIYLVTSMARHYRAGHLDDSRG